MSEWPVILDFRPRNDALPRVCGYGNCLKNAAPKHKYCLTHLRAERRRSAPRAVMPSGAVYIYAIRAPEVGAVKFGVTVDLMRRFSSMQTGSAATLEIAGAVIGQPHYEKAIFEKLAPFRLRGEWYRESPEVKVVVDAIATCDFERFNSALNP